MLALTEVSAPWVRVHSKRRLGLVCCVTVAQALGFQVLLNLARVVLLAVCCGGRQVTAMGPAQHVQVAGCRQLPRVGAYLWFPLRLIELIVALEQELTEVRQLHSGNGLRVNVALIKGLVRFLLVLLDL